MDWESVLIGNRIGGGISLAVSTLFYVLAARGLKEEAAHLRRLNILLIHLLHNAGVIEVKKFDRETGELIRWSVGGQVELRWQVEAPTEETSQEESNEGRN
jgi:hypothetical protein